MPTRPASAPLQASSRESTPEIDLWIIRFAMQPAAAVCALVFANPVAEYFAVDKVCKDQIQDYAARKGVAVEEVERWLRPALAYDADASDEKK